MQYHPLPKLNDPARALSPKNNEGFSLTELLIVIAIIALISTISVPAIMFMRSKTSVRADARDVHSTLRQAQGLAVKQGIDVCVRVDDSTDTYFIYDAFTTHEPRELRPGNTFDNNSFSAGSEACFNMRGLTTNLLLGVRTVDVVNSALTMEVALQPSGHVSSRDK